MSSQNLIDKKTIIDNAACREANLDFFFPENKNPVLDVAFRKRAINYCAVCPVRMMCLEKQIEAEKKSYRYGIFGGLTPSERQLYVQGQKVKDYGVTRKMLLELSKEHTVLELAKITGCSPKNIRRIKRGKACITSEENSRYTRRLYRVWKAKNKGIL